jgi:hypothetical protein
MKKMKTLKIIALTLILAICSTSCKDDGGTSVVPLDEGAVPNMAKSATSDSFIDLVKVNNGEPVSITFSASVAQGNPASTDIIGIYRTLAGPVYSATLFTDVTLPQDFTLSVDDIVAAFDELNTTADIAVGDVLSLTTRFTMADGTVLNILNEDGTNNTGTNIQTTVLFTTIINYPVSCPSNLGGVYNVISNGDNTDGQPPAINVPYVVTITDNGGGSYTISDGVAGVYQFWYCAPYGYCFDTNGTFTDVCGTLTGSWTEAFGCQVNLTGTVNDDGTLSIHWDNCFGDFADAVYTPQ